MKQPKERQQLSNDKNASNSREPVDSGDFRAEKVTQQQ